MRPVHISAIRQDSRDNLANINLISCEILFENAKSICSCSIIIFEPTEISWYEKLKKKMLHFHEKPRVRQMKRFFFLDETCG